MIEQIAGLKLVASYSIPRFVQERRKIPVPRRGFSIYRWVDTDEPFLVTIGHSLYMHPDTWRKIESYLAEHLQRSVEKQFDNMFLQGYEEPGSLYLPRY